jgi:nucleotide-binding universal stress UspA family protein
MKKFLVGVDGSEQSTLAIRKAVEFAAAMKARLVLAYALTPQVYQAADLTTNSPQEAEEAAQKVGERVLEKAAQVVREGGLEAERKLLKGNPSLALANLAADDEQIELVVVGSRGMGPMAGIILGSVADGLVHLSRKPVLVVH